METRPPLIQRAFQLARSGDYDGIKVLRHALTKEGYEGVESRIAGRSLVNQLRRLYREARKASLSPGVPNEEHLRDTRDPDAPAASDAP